MKVGEHDPRIVSAPCIRKNDPVTVGAPYIRGTAVDIRFCVDVLIGDDHYRTQESRESPEKARDQAEAWAKAIREAQDALPS